VIVATLRTAGLWLVLSMAAAGLASAQGRAGGAAPPTPRAAAPIDITGYWVSFVTEDWRYRMMTPRKGDYARMPLLPDARKVADSWNPAADAAAGNQCRAFGAANVMRVPGRFHITWQDDTTLKIDADAGTQTRLLHFTASPPPAERTWQGHSTASWDTAGRSLSVTTTNMRSGYLRFNGVPYSENATLTEHFDLAPNVNGGQLLILTSIVDDPRYLQRPFIVNTHFKKETDGTKWNPIPCTATW
jgi:hypothetical protein